MKIADWLSQKTAELTRADVATARLDCLVLLSDLLNKDKAYVLSHPESILTSYQLKALESQISQRLKHIPLAYIRGKTEFYGREFIINDQVLEPRPESETMIDLLKKLPKSKLIIDVGTGSGALAITAKLETAGQVIAVDIDPNCLEVAKQNCQKYNTKIELILSDLLKALDQKNLSDATLVANLPYVPDNFRLNEAAKNEPALAIFGGVDGLDLYRRLFQQISLANSYPAYILTESLPSQHQALKDIAKIHGYQQSKVDDFIQQFSFVAPLPA